MKPIRCIWEPSCPEVSDERWLRFIYAQNIDVGGCRQLLSVVCFHSGAFVGQQPVAENSVYKNVDKLKLDHTTATADLDSHQAGPK
eukprot:scaffold36795_cov19-Prasinocladus_malaysianus.AAC.2